MTRNTEGLRKHQQQRMAEKLKKPVGLTYDLLHEIRRAMRVLRRAEQWIVREHRAVKRRHQKSGEWELARQTFRNTDGSRKL